MRTVSMPRDPVRRARLESFYTEFQLACCKAGGCITKKKMHNMSLDDFFSICALNNIHIEFKPTKKKWEW